MGGENNTLVLFKKALRENGADFAESLTCSLYQFIRLMLPRKEKSSQTKKSERTIPVDHPRKKEATKFPGLAIPNKPCPLDLETDKESKAKSKSKGEFVKPKDRPP